MNDTTFTVRIRETMSRLDLDDAQAAAYLGVPVFTLRKWAKGDRHPGAAVIRLLDVLGMVEALAPALHSAFLPPSIPAAPKRPKGRVKKSTS